ncbi:MAG TPA: chloride channel protein [Thermoanaerobaculia bacterium]|jgi:CIC family chloride channel protein|nr:chloride channel protein [Thermoanaerobaculia bacterium]
MTRADGRIRFARFFWRDPNTQFLALAVLVGVLGAAGAIVFRTATIWLTSHLLGSPDVVSGASRLPYWRRLLIPAAGGLAGGVIARLFVRTGGTMGIAQIMEVVAVGRRTVRFRQSLARTASSAIVISSGGSEGREGPIIQMGAAFASVVARAIKVSPERARVLVACGMAAGVAGAYNTPISATLFVVELVMGSFTFAVFGPAIVSAFVSALLTRAVLGNAPLYHVTAFELGSLPQTAPFLVLGLVAGLGSVLFMRTIRLSKKLFHQLGWKDEWRMTVGGLGVGALAFAFPEVWGNGFEGTNHLLSARPVLWFFVAIFAAKILATAFTIGSGGVGGVFTPALMTGAALGGSVGIVVARLFPHLASPISSYALLGMGGLLAGTTRAPFLSIIMMVELTQNEDLLLPMMIVALLAISGAKLFERESVYVEELRESGVEWNETPESSALASLRVRDILRSDVELIPQTMRLPEVMKAFLQTRVYYFFVGDAGGRLLGVIDLHDLKDVLGDPELADSSVANLIIAGDIVREIPSVTPEESLASVNEKLWLRDLGWLPVVESPESRKFLGMVTRRDVLGAFERESLRQSHLFARVSRTRLEGGTEVDYFELPEQHRLSQLDVPADLVGETVGETALRSRYGITILAIKRLDRDGLERRFVPAATDRLERGDRLVVLATDEGITRFSQRSDGSSAPEASA